jgi:hypothetical protein
MTNTSWLPKALRWMFAVFSILGTLSAVAFFVCLMVDPTLPPGTHFGPLNADFMGQPGTVALRDSTFVATALHGGINLSVEQAGGLIELLKHYGLPVLILNAVFFAVLFDLLRRLFRNVGRGESFTRQSVRLVQIVGVSLLVFSLVSAFAESWFVHAMYAYLAQHAVISIFGTQLHLPTQLHMSQPHGLSIRIGDHSFPFGTPIFFSGLLVLALSEVFRQGLVLKHENDLTV